MTLPKERRAQISHLGKMVQTWRALDNLKETGIMNVKAAVDGPQPPVLRTSASARLHCANPSTAKRRSGRRTEAHWMHGMRVADEAAGKAPGRVDTAAQ